MWTSPGGAPAGACAENRNTPAITPTSESTLSEVRKVCTRPPKATPARLIAVKTITTPMPSTCRRPNCQLSVCPNSTYSCSTQGGGNGTTPERKIVNATEYEATLAAPMMMLMQT